MPNTLLRNLASALIFLALFVASGYGFLMAFAPKPLPQQLDAFRDYDKAPLEKALAPAAVRAELDRVIDCGSRFLGQPGLDQAAALIRDAYKAAGLTVIEYPQKTAAPATLQRDILGADGKPLADVEVYPFWPNHMQPMVTPEGGLTGRLLLVSDDQLLAEKSFTDAIALVDAAKPPLAYGLSWPKYAQLGFRAVVVAHREGFSKVIWQGTTGGGMVASSPVNYVRLAATEGIFAHAGATVTLKVRTEWRNVDTISLIGLLPAAKGPSEEALVLTTCYDACSVLPDLAPGVLAGTGVASHLAMLKGLTAYRDTLKRDLIFVAYPSQAMGQLPASNVALLFGTAVARAEGLTAPSTERQDNARRAAQVQACLEGIATPDFFTQPTVTAATLARLDPDTRFFLTEEARYVMNRLAFELAEDPLEKRLAFTRLKTRDLSCPEFVAFTTAKHLYDEVTTASGYPLEKLVREKNGILTAHDVPARLRARLEQLGAHHAWLESQLAAAHELGTHLATYRRLVTVGNYLCPSDPEKVKTEKVSLLLGSYAEGSNYLYSSTFNDVLTTTFQRGHYPTGFTYENLRNRWHENWAAQATGGLPVDSRHWRDRGHPAMCFFNSDRTEAYAAWGYPVEIPWMRDVDRLSGALQFAADAILAFAHGEGAFEAASQPYNLQTYAGRVFVANVGRSIVPNFPLAGALVGHKGGSGTFEAPGYQKCVFTFADPYGQYRLANTATAFIAEGMPYGPDACAYGRDGIIAYMKDEGPSGQGVYRSTNLGYFTDWSRVNIVTFRCAPVTLFDMINPQTLSAFTGAALISRDGLAPLVRNNMVPPNANGIVTAFLEPDRPFFVTLKSGAADNKLVQTTRAFLLNVDEATLPAKDREIEGEGYQAYYTPFIRQIPDGIASGLQRLNGKRLALQDKYGMADERTIAFHEKAGQQLAAARAPDLAAHQQHLVASEAATYGILNHPVLRRSIYEAVIGILWYLGLLVPFVFFFEKLVFGYPDIRKQLAAQAGIFLAVFLLLWLLHPAFEMVRSSLMILLGFIVMLVSGGVTLMFYGKFQENLEELRKKRGQVAAAEVNTFGVFGTAFALGLNNMHRRIVRTGLTCLTLVLITFAMICFTSIQSNVVSVSTAIGKAAYQGFLVKPRKMAPISESELFALQTRYSHLYKVSPRRLCLGKRNAWSFACRNPEISLAYEPEGGTPKKRPVASIMTFTDYDPLRERIVLLTQRGWLPAPPEKPDPKAPVPVLISEAMAQELGVTPAQVDAAEIPCELNGAKVYLHGIFKAETLSGLRDLDYRDLLPFDVEAVRLQQLHSPSQLLAEDDDARLSPARLVLAPTGFYPGINESEMRLVSVAVNMPGLSYKNAKAEIDRYLEKSGQETYYGLDGVAYYGKIARESSFAGLVEILIPLIIAAMTVLNTMRGSVYERRSEIFVYNAVGIAPRYIFAMFISEAVVYAVVGSVAGYLLSQGTGRILTAVGWTGGLNMTFTSVTTIYASLAIMAAVFISTWFPARSAMEIAAPAEDAGWHLPPADGDIMSFNLPFTFNFKDRVAVLAFFHRYLADHGEGSSGRFFSGPPRTGVSEESDPQAPGVRIPEIRCTIWLKPFDLGVSQDLVISMPTDPETREFVARIRITRLSGTRESWLRLNPGFVAQLRKNFLFWRAVSLEERARLFEEARTLLRQDLLGTNVSPAAGGTQG